MSKVAFARHLGIGRNTLIHYERGDRVPRSAILARIARADGESVDWLLTGRRAEDIRADPELERSLQRLRRVWRDPKQRPLVFAVLTTLTRNGGQHRAQ